MLTVYLKVKEYGFIKIPSGISLKFQLEQCDGILKWELDGTRRPQVNRPVMFYVIPDHDHPFQEVQAAEIVDHHDEPDPVNS